MENAILVAMSNQIANRRSLDIVANNIANMNTTGFKAENVLFEQILQEVGSGNEVGSEISFVQDKAVFRNFEDGALVETGGAIDLALSGKGFFVVDTPEGQRYTRNGNFKLDEDGRLVTSEMHPVLDVNGNEITIGPDESDIQIAKDGSIETSLGPKTSFNVVTFENLNDMRKIGASMYETEQDPFPADSVTVHQGMIETSNVQPILEVTKMIEVSRAYQSAASIISDAEDLQRKAVNELSGNS